MSHGLNHETQSKIITQFFEWSSAHLCDRVDDGDMSHSDTFESFNTVIIDGPINRGSTTILQ